MAVLIGVAVLLVWYLVGLLAGLIFAVTGGLVVEEFDTADLVIIGLGSVLGAPFWVLLYVFIWLKK